MKGGYKSLVNFSNMLKANIIKAGDTIYFKVRNIERKKIKIPLKLHPNGIIEYNNVFFSDNEGLFILPIEEDTIKLPDYITYEDEDHPIVKKTNKIFSVMKMKENIVYKASDRKSAQKFIYDGETNKSLYILGKKNISKIKEVNVEDETKSYIKIWEKDGIKMRGLGKNSKGGNSFLRYYISGKRVYFKAYEKWSYKNIQLLALFFLRGASRRERKKFSLFF